MDVLELTVFSYLRMNVHVWIISRTGIFQICILATRQVCSEHIPDVNDA